MFLKRTVIIVAGLIFGGATAAGVIALLTTLGFVSRMIARLQLAKDTMHWENVIILGSLSGCLLSVFEPSPVLFSFCQGVAGRVQQQAKYAPSMILFCTLHTFILSLSIYFLTLYHIIHCN